MSEMSLGEGIGIEVSSKMQKRVDKLPQSMHYPTEDLLGEIPADMGPIVRIPRGYLYGRQQHSEYEERKRLLAIKAFEEKPQTFLDEKPVLVCLMPGDGNSSRVVIIDGHHRFRESGRIIAHDADTGEARHLYDSVPCRVFTPAQTADLLNKSGHILDGQPYTEKNLINAFSIQVGSAEEEFLKIMPSHKQPTPIREVRTIEQLQEKFAAAAA